MSSFGILRGKLRGSRCRLQRNFKAKVGRSLGASSPLSSSSHRALSLGLPASPPKQQCLTVLCMTSAGKEGEYEDTMAACRRELTKYQHRLQTGDARRINRGGPCNFMMYRIGFSEKLGASPNGRWWRFSAHSVGVSNC
jgi:hypothetical protein